MSRPRPIPPASKPDEAALKPGDVEVMPVPGLPLAGQKAATVLGLKLTGQWSRRSAPTLAGQWQVTTEAVCQVAAQVDAALEALDLPCRLGDLIKLRHCWRASGLCEGGS